MDYLKCHSIKDIIWNQFGASIDMLINVISNCPELYFEQNKRFYYITFHSVIFLDYYLTIQKESPKEAIDDLIPDKIYSKEELIDYVKKSREKCKQLIFTLTDEKLNLHFKEGDGENDMDYPILEILLYNMRHTQHHVAQLNMLIRQDFDTHLEWSFRVNDIHIHEEILNKKPQKEL